MHDFTARLCGFLDVAGCKSGHSPSHLPVSWPFLCDFAAPPIKRQSLVLCLEPGRGQMPCLGWKKVVGEMVPVPSQASRSFLCFCYASGAVLPQGIKPALAYRRMRDTQAGKSAQWPQSRPQSVGSPDMTSKATYPTDTWPQVCVGAQRTAHRSPA